jgi:transcriptional regulator with XRE-family HTH domain
MTKKIEVFYEALGANIQNAREGLKLTQTQLGSSLTPPSTRASIANIEGGKQRVLVHTLVQMAKTLEITVEKLLPVEEPRVSATLTEVENELKRKLNLKPHALKKLAGAASPADSKNGARA